MRRWRGSVIWRGARGSPLELAQYCGATRIANRARAELIAAGAKPQRDAITGRDALTAAELQVARLAAQGLTNREIAQALFITTKTTTGHLSRMYRKVDINPATASSPARSPACTRTPVTSNKAPARPFLKTSRAKRQDPPVRRAPRAARRDSLLTKTATPPNVASVTCSFSSKKRR